MCTAPTCSHDPLDDDVSDIFGGALSSEDRTAGEKIATEATQMRMHEETCKACRGTGRFVGYSGRVLGACFKCKGKGKRFFRTSLAQREKAQAAAANRRERKEQDTRAAAAAWGEANPAEMAWLQEASGRGFEFAVSMLEALRKYGHFTERQLAAVQSATAKSAARKAERDAETAARAAAAPSVDVSAIETAFATATANGLRNPKLRLDTFKFTPAKAHSKNAGAIYVTHLEETGRDGDALYLGKIMDGKFYGVRACTPEMESRIVAVASDPAAAAVAYGNRTGSCAICGRELTNKESVERGIGPICAGKYAF